MSGATESSLGNNATRQESPSSPVVSAIPSLTEQLCISLDTRQRHNLLLIQSRLSTVALHYKEFISKELSKPQKT
jgi:hypothetical protein